MRPFRPWLALLMLLATAVAFPLAAQQRGGSAAVLTGFVVDAETGARLSGATVESAPEQRRAVTDREGAFRLSLRPGRDYVLAVTLLGYETQRVVVSALAGGAAEPMTFSLTPEPLVLERVEVLVDRFETRRHRVPVSSFVLGRERLARSGGTDLAQAVRSSAMLTTTSCARASSFGSFSGWNGGSVSGNYCLVHRGTVVAPTVYLDDRRMFGGLDDLAGYSPWEMHHVEIYQRGLSIRAYTMSYVESLARGNRRLPHMVWW